MCVEGQDGHDALESSEWIVKLVSESGGVAAVECAEYMCDDTNKERTKKCKFGHDEK